MNRAERRRQLKASQKVHVITRDDIMFQKGVKAGMAEGIKLESGQSVCMMTTAIAAVLHREYGFGAHRLDMVLNHITAVLETYKDDLDRERRTREWIKDKTGLDLDDYTGRRVLDLKKQMQMDFDAGQFIKRGVVNEDTQRAAVPEMRI